MLACFSSIAGCGPPVASLRRHFHSKSETEKTAQGKRGRKPQGPQYPLSPCTPGRTAPPALMRSEHAVVRVSITHHPPKAGKPNLSNSGKPGVFHQPPSPQMLCRSRCSPCAPYGSPSRIHGSQSTSSEQENTERVLKEN